MTSSDQLPTGSEETAPYGSGPAPAAAPLPSSGSAPTTCAR